MYKPLKKVNYFILFFMVVIFCATALFVVNLNFHSEENKVYAATYGNFVYENVSGGVKITGYNATGTVNIPEDINGKKVVEISQDAFQGNTGITVVNIPRYVVKVGSYTKVDTFVGCSSLQAINVDTENDYYKSDSGVFYSHENGVPITLNVYPANRSGTSYTVLSGTKYIGSGAFKNAKNLTRIDLASTVYHIGNFAFEGCSNLDFFTIVSSVRIVGAFAFKDCTKLNTLTISSTDFTLGQYAFQNTRIYNDASDDSVYSRGNWVLGYKNTTYASDPNYPETWGLTGALTIPSGTVGIAGGAFDGSRISSVNFPSTLKYIGDNAFSFIRTFEPGSVNISIDIPASVEKIGAYAFYKSRISTVKLNGTSLTHIGARAFSDIQISSITIPSSVQEIGDEAFRDCTSLSTISFTADNIKRIGKDAFTNTARFNASTGVRIINNWVVGNRNGATGSPSFSNVRGFADYALEGTSITGASLPSTVYYIGEGAFKDCSNLSSVSISGNVDYIPPYAFAGCTSLKSITINSGVKTIGEKAFNGSMDGSPTINIPDSVQTIEDYAFQDSNVGRLNFNSSSNLGHIGNYAFYGSALNTINIPASVEFIGRYAFRDTGIYNSASTNSFVYINNWAVDYKGDRSSLDSVSIDGSTKGFASLTFANMQALERVILPASVNYIGDHAFYMCYNLEKVMVLTSTVATAGKGIYNNVKNGDHEVVTYVMQNQVNNYKAAQNWENYDNYIDSIAVVNISKQTGGNIINGSSGYYFPDEGMALQVSYNQGYYFTGWWSGASVLNRSKAYTYTTQRGDQTILAKFNAIDVNNINETFDNAIVPASFNPISGYNSLITYSTGAVAPINAGSHTATIKVRCTALNNEVVGEKTIAINISKRTLYITPQANPITYGDDPPASYNMQTDNVAPNDSVTVNVTGSCDYQKYDDVGAYDIYVKAADQTFSHNNYTPQYQTGTLIVNKKKVTLSIAVVGDVYYGDNPPENFTFNYSGLVNGDQISDTAYTDYYYKGNAGSYNIYVTEKAHTNYYVDNIASAKGTFTVKKKPITVIIYDQYIDYGDSIPTFTYSQGDLVSGDSNLTHIVETDYVLGESDCGEYSITPVDGQNNFTNYDVTYVNGTLTVLRRDIEVTAEDKSMAYGDSFPQFTFTYVNVVNNDDVNFVETVEVVDYDTFNGMVGVYEIKITTDTLAHANYNVTVQNSGQLTVNKRPLTITPISREIIFGDRPHTSFQYNIENIMEGENVHVTAYTDYKRYQPAGKYAIIVNPIHETNYSYDGGTFEELYIVNKRSIVVIAENKTIKYNEEPEFTFVYSGRVAEDALLDEMEAQTKADTNYVVGSDVGYYNITIDRTVVYTNYVVDNYIDGMLQVVRADAIITVEEYQQTHTYDGTVKEVQAFLNHSETGFEYELVEYSYDSERGAPEFAPENIYLGGYINSGIYVINIIAPESKNYLASQTEQVTLIINRRPITVTADQASKIFGDQDPEVLTYKITTGTLGAEDNSLNGTLTRDAGEICDAIYYIRQGTVTTENNPNYDISFSSGVRFIINKREIRVVADDKVVTYGDETPELTITYINIIEGYEPDPSEEYIYTLYSQYQDAGEYTIYIEGRMYDNYVIKDDMPENGLLTVLRKKLTITAYEEITYGDPIPVFKSFIFDGLVADDTVPVIAYTDYQRYDDSGDYIILFDDSVLEEYEYRNYDAEFITGVLKVGKKDLIITADNKTIYYGDNAPEFTFSYIGLINGDVVEDIATTDYVLYDPVGTYRIIPFENEYRNYLGVQYNEGELIVEKRPIAITADDKEILFNEEAPQFTFTFENVVNEDRLEAWATTNYQKGDPVGAYTITVVPDLVYDNYVVAQTYEGTLNVIHAVAEIFAEELQTHIYDKTIKEVAAVLNHDETVLKYEPQKGYVNAGTYTIRVYAETTQNYQAVERVITLVIERRDLTIQADYKEKIYGEADPALTYQYDQEALILTDEITGTLVREEGQDVGEYEIKQGNVDAGDNYNIIYISSFLKINPKPIEVTANPQQKVYGYSDPVLDYVITAGELLEGDELSGGLERETGEDVDEYEIGIGDLFNKNYAITFISDYLTIVPRPITIKAVSNSKIYGEADPVIAYDVIVGELAFDDKLSGRFEREDGEDIGFYEIYQGQVDEERNPNYEIEFIFDSLVKFEIKERPITVTADRIVKTYGDIDPELTYQITQGSLAFDDEFIGSLIREEGQDVKEGGYQISRGSFAISDGNLGQNYDLTFIGNIFEIEKRTIIIQAHGDQKTYGENDPPIFEYTMIEGNLAYDDQLEGRLSRDWGENAGDYNINKGTLRIVRTVSGQTETVDFNYDFVYILAIFKINPLKIVVKAEDLSQMYGYPDHQLVYEIIGTQLLEGDELQGQIKRDEGLDVGSYVIRQGDLGNPNYEIEFINATYTIYPRQIMIKAVSTSKVYGDDDPIIEYEVVQSELAYDDVLNGRFARVEGRNVGSYAITQGTIDSAHNPNYIIEYEPGGILTITKRSIIVIPEDKEIRYGDSAPHFTFIYENIAYDDVLVDTASTNYVRFMGVGDYDIIMNPRTYANYVAEYRMGTLKVVKRPVIITPNPAYVEFGSDPPEEFTFSYDGLVNNDKLQDTGYTDYQKGDYAGEYTIFVNEREYDNYIGTYRTGILYVIKARTIITGEIKQTKEYNGKEQTVDIEVNHNESELYYEPAGCINAGTYEIIVTTLETENHSAGLATFTLIIKPRVLRIEALSKNKNYGDDDPELEYEITEGELVEGDTLSGSLFRDFGQGVGEYEINQGTLSAGQNYEIVFVPGIFNIIPKQILIKPEERDKVYGEADPHFAYTTEGDGLVGGDRLEGTLAREQGEGVGTYRIIIGTLSHSNYEIDIAEAYFTIRPRNITIRAIDKEKVYGEEDPEMEYEIVFGSLAFEDELMGFLSREEGENVGEYEIQLGTIDNENNPNYNISLATGGRLTILKRSLTIEPEQMTKIYGYPDPELTYNIIEGELVNEDTLSGQLSRDPGNDAGEYAIRLGSLTAGENYQITFIEGIEFIILRRPITIIASNHKCEYGKVSGFELTFEIEGNIVPADRDRIYRAVYMTSVAKSDSPIGEYIVFINLVETFPNYDINLLNGTLEIIPATLDIDPNQVFPDKRVLYDGSEHTILINTEKLDLMGYHVTYQNNKGVEIGVYEATATITKQNHQTLTLNAKLIIMKNTATSIGGIYQGSLIKDDGLDPYVELMITQSTDEYILSLAQADIRSDKEEVKSIMNINLFSEGEEINIAGGAEIRLRIPPEVKDIDSLRLVYISDDTVQEVSYTVDGNYIVFDGNNLGSYAFITISDEALRTENLAKILFYTFIAVLVIVAVIVISAAIMNKSS